MPYKPKSKVQPYQKIKPLKEEPIALSLFNRSRKSKLPLFGKKREDILYKLLQNDFNALSKERITVFKGVSNIPAYPTTAPITTLLEYPYFKDIKLLRELYRDNKKSIPSKIASIKSNKDLSKKAERFVNYLSEMGINDLGGLQSVIDNPSQKIKLIEKLRKEFPEFTLPLTNLFTGRNSISLYSLNALATTDIYDALGYGPKHFQDLLRELIMTPINIKTDGAINTQYPFPLKELIQITARNAPIIAIMGHDETPLPLISINRNAIPKIRTLLQSQTGDGRDIDRALDSIIGAINGYLKTPILSYIPQIVDDAALLRSTNKLHTLSDFLEITPRKARISAEGKHFLNLLANSKNEYLHAWSNWAEKLLTAYSILYEEHFIPRQSLKAVGIHNLGAIKLESTPRGIAPGEYEVALNLQNRVPQITLTSGNTIHMVSLPELLRQYSSALSNAYNKLYNRNKNHTPPQKQGNPNQNRNYPQQRPQQKNNRGIEDIYKLLERNEKSQQQGYSGGYFRPR